MLKNYLKTAWRNLTKNKTFSLINIVGLAIGMAVCILILLFVSYERSFDNFHKKNIYRLNEVQKFEGMLAYQKVGLSMFPMGPTLKNEFPEIKNFTRIHWVNKYQMTAGDKRLYFPQMFFVDSTFFQVFDFKLLTGDKSTVLQKPNSAVLTEETAKKLFGDANPIGKTITHYEGDTLSFVVTGIMQNVPQNSQLQFDGLFSFSTIFNPDINNNWGGNWLDTYLELAPGTNMTALEKKFPAYLKKYLARDDGWKSYELFLLPLKDVHANAVDIGLDYLNYQKFDKSYTNIFFAIALVILLIACINFMNLATARSAERAKEVGIRKSIGAYRWQLAIQFMSETIILCLIALLLAIGLVELSLPYINALIQRNLQFALFSNFWLFISLILGSAVIGLISGLYPAAYLSSFEPVKVLKGSVQTGKNKSLFRNVLVIGQFSTAIFLMISTIFLIRQLSYMQGKDPGFVRKQVINIPLDGITYKKYDALKQDLLRNPLISGVTASQDILGSHLDQTTVEFTGAGPTRKLTSTLLIVDHDYLNLFKIPLAYGRNFSNEKSANGKEYIINQALAKELLKDKKQASVESLLGKHFGFDSAGTIVGIAKDFNFNSLHYKIETLFMFNQKEWGFNNLSVKINGDKAKESLAYIETVWRKNFLDHPLEYQFLDDHFEELYRADTQITSIVAMMAILAIIISCLGLFGMASYSAEKRFKEIGIRKVLGASVQNIIGMLSKDFLRHVLIATLIAWPIAWLCINKWLQDFAYRVNLSWWVFILAGVAALLIALLTISFQAIRAATANPVESLRTE